MRIVDVDRDTAGRCRRDLRQQLPDHSRFIHTLLFRFHYSRILGVPTVVITIIRFRRPLPTVYVCSVTSILMCFTFIAYGKYIVALRIERAERSADDKRRRRL